MSASGVVIDAEVIAEHLTAPHGSVPLLRVLLEIVPCYTTFVQVSELYSLVKTPEDKRIVDRSLFGLKILGASSRYAKTIGELLSSYSGNNALRNAVTAAIAIESKLPVISDTFFAEFVALPRLRVLRASDLRSLNDPVSMLQAIDNTV